MVISKICSSRFLVLYFFNIEQAKSWCSYFLGKILVPLLCWLAVWSLALCIFGLHGHLMIWMLVWMSCTRVSYASQVLFLLTYVSYDTVWRSMKRRRYLWHWIVQSFRLLPTSSRQCEWLALFLTLNAG